MKKISNEEERNELLTRLFAGVLQKKQHVDFSFPYDVPYLESHAK